jgi:hypothetical protein
MIDPSRNGVTIDIKVCRQLKTVRLRLEPSCTTPWSGTNAVGDSRFAIVASTKTPPPRPNAPAIKLPKKRNAAKDEESCNGKIGILDQDSRMFYRQFLDTT